MQRRNSIRDKSQRKDATRAAGCHRYMPGETVGGGRGERWEAAGRGSLPAPCTSSAPARLRPRRPGNGTRSARLPPCAQALAAKQPTSSYSSQHTHLLTHGAYMTPRPLPRLSGNAAASAHRHMRRMPRHAFSAGRPHAPSLRALTARRGYEGQYGISQPQRYRFRRWKVPFAMLTRIPPRQPPKAKYAAISISCGAVCILSIHAFRHTRACHAAT